MSSDLATDFKAMPYWWDLSPLDTGPAPDLPAHADAVVVGSGYTGLHAALQIARAGREVVVIESGAPGQGCSTRNGGQISHSVKPTQQELSRRFGKDVANAILSDGFASRRFVEDFIRSEQLDCAFDACGRFHAAHNSREFETLQSWAKSQPDGYETSVSLVPRDRQTDEIGSDFYHGGLVFHDHAALDPGQYHAGLLRLVRQAGATVIPHTRAIGFSTGGGGKIVATASGEIAARDVVLATNGYTGDTSPWHRDRIIPIGSYMIATEELPPDLTRSLFPTGRIVSDSRRVVYYYRLSPDRKRVLFGGRVSAGEIDPVKGAARLAAAMRRIFPQLEGRKISHAWMGFVAYTFDTMAHIGHQDRVHYAMGYCGSGVGMASYLGNRVGLGIVDQQTRPTGLASAPFPTRALYNGKPWFLPAAVEYYRLRDRLGL